MIKSLLDFIKTEKTTVVIFLIVLALGIYTWMHAKSQEKVAPRPADTPAVQKFKGHEMQLREKIEAAGSFDEYFRDRPSAVMALNFILLLLVLILGTGVILNIVWLFNQKFRDWLKVAIPPSSVEWGFGMLFKVAVYFVFASYLLSAIFELLRFAGLVEMSMNTYLLIHTTIVDVLALALIYYAVKQKGGTWRDIGLHSPLNALKEALLGFSAYIAVLPLFVLTLIAVVVVSQIMAYDPPAHPLVNVFLEEEKKAPWLVGYSIFLASVLGPMLEEVFFRGFCYPILKRKIGMFWGMIITAAFFAWVHDNTFAFFPIFVLGLGLAYVYEQRGSLVAPMIMHVTHNLSFITYFFLVKKFVLQEVG